MCSKQLLSIAYAIYNSATKDQIIDIECYDLTRGYG